MRNLCFAALSAVLLGLSLSSARAQYSQNFDTGSAAFTGDSLWLNNSLADGFIIKDTNTVFGGAFNGEITSDVSGTGYFLFDGTAVDPGSVDRFFISPTFSVNPNTNYDVSFYLTSSNGINSPIVQAEIDGTLVGSQVTPVGAFNPNGWQQFTSVWNSGSNTSASLVLHDLVGTGTGNDFGIDNISVLSQSSPAGTPEPGPVAVLVGLAISVPVCLRRKRKVYV